ncbi:MAG: acyltransferase family protein [Planctomycetota bacterium]|nr:acyltransferase family protein [Planctomycetota bacterium]
MSTIEIATPGPVTESSQPTVRQEYASVRSQSDRVHYLDNLRGVAMLLGVFLHAALAYAHPTQIVWLATDPQSSVLVDAAFSFIHLFRMGLFFLISGYFAKLLITRRGTMGFVRNRAVRIVLPFILFYPFLLGLVIAAVVFAMSYLSHPLGLIGLIVKASKENPQGTSAQPWSTMHLWFLYYLTLFAALTVVLSRFRPLRFDWLSCRPWLVALTPLALVPGVLLGGLGIPAPESFIPLVWPLLFYGLFYWAGWQFFGREESLAAFKPWTGVIAAVGCALFVPYYLLLPKVEASIFETGAVRTLSPGLTLLAGVLTAYLATLLTLLSLLIGQQYLSRRSPVLRLMSDASYWTYLVHLPVVYFLQTLLIEAPLGLVVKLLLVNFGTLLFCMATYLVFVRYTPIGWMLNGKRAFP